MFHRTFTPPETINNSSVRADVERISRYRQSVGASLHRRGPYIAAGCDIEGRDGTVTSREKMIPGKNKTQRAVRFCCPEKTGLKIPRCLGDRILYIGQLPPERIAPIAGGLSSELLDGFANFGLPGLQCADFFRELKVAHAV